MSTWQCETQHVFTFGAPKCNCGMVAANNFTTPPAAPSLPAAAGEPTAVQSEAEQRATDLYAALNAGGEFLERFVNEIATLRSTLEAREQELAIYRNQGPIVSLAAFQEKCAALASREARIGELEKELEAARGAAT